MSCHSTRDLRGSLFWRALKTKNKNCTPQHQRELTNEDQLISRCVKCM